MNVVRHHDEGMQVVVTQGVPTLQDGLYHQTGDLRPSQIKWAGTGLIQQAVHGYERFSSAQAACGEEAVPRQTVV